MPPLVVSALSLIRLGFDEAEKVSADFSSSPMRVMSGAVIASYIPWFEFTFVTPV